jgi:hypothetical protein
MVFKISSSTHWLRIMAHPFRVGAHTRGGHRDTRLEGGQQPATMPGGGCETHHNRRTNGLAWGFEGSPPRLWTAQMIKLAVEMKEGRQVVHS